MAGKFLYFRMSLFFSVVFAFLFFSFAFPSFGFGISVVKSINNSNLKQFGNLSIFLVVRNPFSSNVSVEIHDKNIVGNSGYDVKCLERVIPANKTVVLEYAPFELFSSGNFTLPSANLTYVNPVTFKKSTAVSNSLKISVAQANRGQNSLSATGIVSVYKCNGISMQSSSFSSTGGSVNFQMSNNGFSASFNNAVNSMNQMMNQAFGSSSTQNDYSRPSAANSQQLQRQVKKQLAKESSDRASLAKDINSSRSFESIKKSLESQGFHSAGSNINPYDNSSGSFNYLFSSKDGSLASVFGNVDNGKVSNLTEKFTYPKGSFGYNRLSSILSKNSNYNSIRKMLDKKGFYGSSIVETKISRNASSLSKNSTGTKTSLVQTFNNENNLTKKVSAILNNNTVTNVSLVKNNLTESGAYDKNLFSGFDFDMFLAVALMIAVIGFVWLLVMRKSDKKRFLESLNEVVPDEDKALEVDYVTECNELMKKALVLYDKGNKKDAYFMMSLAIRKFISFHFGSKGEISSSEASLVIKKADIKYSVSGVSAKALKEKIIKILQVCDLVEFAKFMPKDSEFFKMHAFASKVLSSFSDMDEE